MKIAIIYHKIIKGDGQGRTNYEIAKEALNQNYKLVLVASEIDESLKKNKDVIYKIIDVKKWPTELIRNLIFAYKSRRWLKKNKRKYDLLMVNGFITFFPSDINQVQFIHNAWIKSPTHTFKIRRDFYGIYQWIYTKLNSYLEKYAFKKSNIIVADSTKVKEDLIKIGTPKEKIRVILNGVNINEFFPGKSNRKELKLHEKIILALSVGDIKTSRKNLDTTLKALTNIPNLYLVVVGDKKNSPYIKLAKQLKLTERVHFLGFRKDIATIMRSVDFFIFPTRYEPFGNVILEAMASGLPVITSKIAGCSQIITKKSGILLKNPEDYKKLEQEIKFLIKNPKKIKDMGKEARKIAEKYTWKKTAKQYIDLFHIHKRDLQHKNKYELPWWKYRWQLRHFRMFAWLLYGYKIKKTKTNKILSKKNKIYLVYFSCGNHFRYLFASLKSLEKLNSQYIRKIYLQIDKNDYFTDIQMNKLKELNLNLSINKTPSIKLHGISPLIYQFKTS